MKLWEKGKPLNKQIEEFTVGHDYVLDQKLLKYDCIASIAHAKMLGKVGILQNSEVQKLTDELNNIIELDEAGKFKIQLEQEDCHTAIELHLTSKLGELGKKIHTARSRNDQVLTALRLYYKDELHECKKRIEHLNSAIGNFTKKHDRVRFPGYTHTRKAMPSSITMWGNSFVDSMLDNLKLVDTVYELLDQSPLGTGAGYGIPLAIDRHYAAEILGFKNVQNNPVYTQHSRGKFESTLVHTLSQIMFDLNRIASDLILFSMPELGYFELPEDFCTGSSIMPQKKNPDVLELVRAQYHAIVALEFQLKTIMANLISGYHRDLQLTKEATMKSLEIAGSCLPIMTLIFENLSVNQDRCQRAMTEEIFATQEVYELVKKGIPFREAYKTISKKY